MTAEQDIGSLPPPPSAARSSAAQSHVDAALAARLDRLTAARAGSDRVPSAERLLPVAKRRRHPAKGSRTAALALSVLASGGLGFWFSRIDPGAAAASAEAVGIVPATTSTPQPTQAAPTTEGLPSATAPSTATSDTSSPASTSDVTATAEPTTINGQSFHNEYGDVQVQATFGVDGSITAVDAVHVPFRDSKSVRINDRAVPRLNSEALSTQSGTVDTVSGATYTSIGYRQSLQSAIDIAISNGIPVPAATA